MESKKWYESKTLWVNIISIIGIFTASKSGVEMSPEMVTTVLGVINMVLRFVTKKEIAW